MPDTHTNLSNDAAEFLAAHPDIEAIDVIFADLAGVVRGKRYPIDQLGKLVTDGLAIPGSVFLLTTTGESLDPEGLGFSDGDPDQLVRLIPGSLQSVPWAERPTAQAMMTLVDGQGNPYPYEPRNVLRRIVDEVKALGVRPVIAFELEFFLVDRERTSDHSPQPPISPLTGRRDDSCQVYGMNEVEAFADLLQDIAEACRQQGIQTGAITAEYAPGQYEINLHHLDDPLLAADQCVMFKRAAKGVARKYGLQVTFMAKPYLEYAGSGLHLHASLIDDKGHNVFDGGEAIASDTLRHAIGGILDILPESMAILAPNINSFRRFKPNIFVPIRRSWGFENRSVALRVPRGPGAARRIEHRIAGADANPYLALATALAGIHHGITNRIDPGPPFEGNAGYAFDPKLPMRPYRSLEIMRKSKVLPRYLGRDYFRAYIACKYSEYQQFDDQITPVEYDWYLQAE